LPVDHLFLGEGSAQDILSHRLPATLILTSDFHLVVDAKPEFLQERSLLTHPSLILFSLSRSFRALWRNSIWRTVFSESVRDPIGLRQPDTVSVPTPVPLHYMGFQVTLPCNASQTE
jgi:hypothetical protein